VTTTWVYKHIIRSNLSSGQHTRVLCLHLNAWGISADVIGGVCNRVCLDWHNTSKCSYLAVVHTHCAFSLHHTACIIGYVMGCFELYAYSRCTFTESLQSHNLRNMILDNCISCARAPQLYHTSMLCYPDVEFWNELFAPVVWVTLCARFCYWRRQVVSSMTRQDSRMI
jgi:hypothetical protein